MYEKERWYTSIVTEAVELPETIDVRNKYFLTS